jgi:hypothetical protein
MIRVQIYRDNELSAEERFADLNDVHAVNSFASWANGLLRDAPQGVYDLLIENQHGDKAFFFRDTRIVPCLWERRIAAD